MRQFALGILLGMMLVMSIAFTYPGDGANGWVDTEDWTAAAANALETALDTIENNISTLQARDTIAEHESVDGVNVITAAEIQTGAALNALILDTDFVTATGTFDFFVTGSAVFSGTIEGTTAVYNQSGSTFVMTSGGTRGPMHQMTNTAGVVITLPSVASGMNACFRDATTSGGGVVRIDVTAGDLIELDGVALDAGDAINSPGNKGDFICLLGVSDSTWVSLGRSGTWIDGGP